MLTRLLAILASMALGASPPHKATDVGDVTVLLSDFKQLISHTSSEMESFLAVAEQGFRNPVNREQQLEIVRYLIEFIDSLNKINENVTGFSHGPEPIKIRTAHGLLRSSQSVSEALVYMMSGIPAIKKFQTAMNALEALSQEWARMVVRAKVCHSIIERAMGGEGLGKKVTAVPGVGTLFSDTLNTLLVYNLKSIGNRLWTLYDAENGFKNYRSNGTLEGLERLCRTVRSILEEVKSIEPIPKLIERWDVLLDIIKALGVNYRAKSDATKIPDLVDMQDEQAVRKEDQFTEVKVSDQAVLDDRPAQPRSLTKNQRRALRKREEKARRASVLSRIDENEESAMSQSIQGNEVETSNDAKKSGISSSIRETETDESANKETGFILVGPKRKKKLRLENEGSDSVSVRKTTIKNTKEVGEKLETARECKGNKDITDTYRGGDSQDKKSRFEGWEPGTVSILKRPNRIESQIMEPMRDMDVIEASADDGTGAETAQNSHAIGHWEPCNIFRPLTDIFCHQVKVETENGKLSVDRVLALCDAIENAAPDFETTVGAEILRRQSICVSNMMQLMQIQADRLVSKTLSLPSIVAIPPLE